MNIFLQKLIQIPIDFIKHKINTVRNHIRWVNFPALRDLLDTLFRQGGVLVQTDFSYADQPYYFRTNIQIDGQVINIVPDPACYKQDPGWVTLWQQQHQQHQQKIQITLAPLNDLQAALMTAATMMSSTGFAWWAWMQDWVNQLSSLWQWVSQLIGVGLICLALLMGIAILARKLMLIYLKRQAKLEW